MYMYCVDVVFLPHFVDLGMIVDHAGVQTLFYTNRRRKKLVVHFDRLKLYIPTGAPQIYKKRSRAVPQSCGAESKLR